MMDLCLSTTAVDVMVDCLQWMELVLIVRLVTVHSAMLR